MYAGARPWRVPARILSPATWTPRRPTTYIYIYIYIYTHTYMYNYGLTYSCIYVYIV